MPDVEVAAQGDVTLLQMGLDDCKKEITRLRAVNRLLVAALKTSSDEGADRVMKVAIGRGEIPTRVWPGDAGFDLYVSESVWIGPGQFKDVPCSVAIQLPPNTWGLIIGRSSTLRTKGLMVTQGVIDNGYRGPMFAGVWNLTGEGALASEGERLAQLIPMPLVAAEIRLEVVDQLDPGDRGLDGFGSTGR